MFALIRVLGLSALVMKDFTCGKEVIKRSFRLEMEKMVKKFGMFLQRMFHVSVSGLRGGTMTSKVYNLKINHGL